MSTSDRKEKVRKIRQEDIINAAEKVFFAKGFHNATMDEVAKEAEYSKRTIYVYFSSKEQIYDAIILRAYQHLNRMFKTAVEHDNPADGLKKVLLLGKTYLEFVTAFPEYFEAMIQYENREEDLINQDEFKAASYREGDVSVALLIGFIREGIADGSITADFDATNLAFVLYANIIGTGNLILKKEKYIRHSYQKDLPELISEQFKLLVRALKP